MSADSDSDLRRRVAQLADFWGQDALELEDAGSPRAAMVRSYADALRDVLEETAPETGRGDS